ncbi:MAG TPA: hypothetical protein VFT04_04300 [Gemmatimonadales bacterium]|nr:hypothetical protein [Gemmatimonadales bacterium]
MGTIERLGAAALLIAAAACAREPRSGVAEQDSALAATLAVAQLTFDPSRIRSGQQVGSLAVDSVEVAWSEALSTWTGTVRFRGELPLRGHAIRHFDYPEVQTICFEADSASALSLPRWPDDDRRPWFCFENDSTAQRILGAADSTRPVDIVIDRFTTVRAFTDAVNSARLLEADACYLSRGPILARFGADTAGPGAWLRFAHGLVGDSGIARLVEPNGAALAVRWRRARGALELHGFDDLVRFEALLALRGDSLSGEARLSSDAQLERDARGELIPSARRWLLVAFKAPCDSAATAWDPRQSDP